MYLLLHPHSAALGKSNRSQMSCHPVCDVFHPPNARYPREITNHGAVTEHLQNATGFAVSEV